MTSALNNNFLSSDKDTNRFKVKAGIEFQIFYSTIRNFISCANWNPQQHFSIFNDGNLGINFASPLLRHLINEEVRKGTY